MWGRRKTCAGWISFGGMIGMDQSVDELLHYHENRRMHSCLVMIEQYGKTGTCVPGDG